ncbi:MAG: MEKHLA domain-containing protein [Verrucomicrobiota bacterium]
MASSSPQTTAQRRQAKLILESYERILGKPLIPEAGSQEEAINLMWTSPFVILSSAPDAETTLNYGNLTALRLWEMDWNTLCRTSSRHTAEPEHRDERERYMKQVREIGYIKDYSGIRISRTGKRFRIEKATVWNLTDNERKHLGQAATFSRWIPLKDNS